MNSSAASCGDKWPCLHTTGKVVPEALQVPDVAPLQVLAPGQSFEVRQPTHWLPMHCSVLGQSELTVQDLVQLPDTLFEQDPPPQSVVAFPHWQCPAAAPENAPELGQSLA